MNHQLDQCRIAGGQDVSRSVRRVRLLATLAGLPSRQRARFGRAVAEIAQNAMEYAGEGTVELWVVDHGPAHFIEAVVRDRGPGIGNPECSGADVVAASPGKPSGIALAKSLVERFSLESEPNKGTVVRLGQSVPPSVPLSEDVLADWATVLSSKSTQDALLASLARVLELSGQLTFARREGLDLKQELRDLRSLGEENSLLALVASRTNTAVTILSADGVIAWANEAFTRLTAYQPAEIAGQRFVDLLLSPGVETVAVKEIDQALRRGRPATSEVLVHRKNGRRLWGHCDVTPVLDDDRRLVRWIVLLSDVTKRREAQQALERAKQSAEEASRLKSEFLANMSHEIRTPMNAIIGMTELALTTELTAEQRAYLATAKDSAEALLRLLNDILDLSKIEAKRLEIDAADFNLAELLGQTLRTMAVRAGRKGLELVCDVPPTVPEYVRGDPARLRQVIVNLVDNAIKFTEQGEIVVSVVPEWQTGDEVSLAFSVSDTGIGIPADRLERVFEAFRQVDSSTTRRYGGTGLGLSISSQLVELMGGKMWAQSLLRRGSTFHFTLRLPLGTKPAETTTAANVSELVGISPLIVDDDVAGRRIPGRRLTVLIADDHEANRRLAARILEKRGHDVHYAPGGAEALAAIRNRRFDVVVMDVQMPEMDGFAATAAIRELEKETGDHMPVIAMTAYAMKGDRERCLAAGMDAYIAKPIRAEQLEALVESLGTAGEPELPPRAVASETPDFDFQPALARLKGDERLLREQMEIFLDDAPTLVADIRSTLKRQDGQALEFASHRLKGLAGSLDGHRVVEQAARLEQLARQGALAEAGPACDRLEARFAEFCRAVSKYVGSD